MTTITTRKWTHIVSRRRTILCISAVSEASMVTTKEYVGTACRFLTINTAELADVYLNTADCATLGKQVLKRIEANANFATEHAADCLAECERFVKLSGGLSRLKGDETKAELAIFFKRYYEAYVSFAKFMVIPVAIERALTNMIKTALIARVGEVEANEYLTKLMTPPSLSEFQKEQIDLLKISLLAFDADMALEAHREKYAWLACYNVDEMPYTSEYYQERLRGLEAESLTLREQQLAELAAQVRTDKEVYTTTIATLGFDGELLGAIELLRQYVYLRTFRIEMNSKSNYYIQPLFKQIAKELFLSLRQTAALTPNELLTALRGKNIVEAGELEKRIKEYGLRYDENGITLVTGSTATAQLALEELGETTEKQTNEVSGTIAFKGSAKGKVRVVITKQDIAAFEKGEILVTTMTTPEFVPAMKKAIAIVTNEGGVLCHAAIVARELKVPCIIGTVRATKIFKNGETVMVDGEKGVVRKV